MMDPNTAFNLLDANNDGRITRSEFEAGVAMITAQGALLPTMFAPPTAYGQATSYEAPPTVMATRDFSAPSTNVVMAQLREQSPVGVPQPVLAQPFYGMLGEGVEIVEARLVEPGGGMMTVPLESVPPVSSTIEPTLGAAVMGQTFQVAGDVSVTLVPEAATVSEYEAPSSLIRDIGQPIYYNGINWEVEGASETLVTR